MRKKPALPRAAVVLLDKSAKSGGHVDRTLDWPSVTELERRGLVTVTETMIVRRGVGLVPAPRLTVTAAGQEMRRALAIVHGSPDRT